MYTELVTADFKVVVSMLEVSLTGDNKKVEVAKRGDNYRLVSYCCDEAETAPVIES